MITYRTTGHLTHAIPQEGRAAAIAYLAADDMTKYMDDSIKDVIAHVWWTLDSNGLDYRVDAKALRELTADELRVLSEWVSGQNSDGRGEGFEQQDFAWVPAAETDWYSGDGQMCSFDWETNDSVFVRVS